MRRRGINAFHNQNRRSFMSGTLCRAISLTHGRSVLSLSRTEWEHIRISDQPIFRVGCIIKYPRERLGVTANFKHCRRHLHSTVPTPQTIKSTKNANSIPRDPEDFSERAVFVKAPVEVDLDVGDLVEFKSGEEGLIMGIVIKCPKLDIRKHFINQMFVVLAGDGRTHDVEFANVKFKIPGWSYHFENTEFKDWYDNSEYVKQDEKSKGKSKLPDLPEATLKMVRSFKNQAIIEKESVAGLFEKVYKEKDLIKVDNSNKMFVNIGDVSRFLFSNYKNESKIKNRLKGYDIQLYATYMLLYEDKIHFFTGHQPTDLVIDRKFYERNKEEVDYINEILIYMESVDLSGTKSGNAENDIQSQIPCINDSSKSEMKVKEIAAQFSNFFKSVLAIINGIDRDEQLCGKLPSSRKGALPRLEATDMIKSIILRASMHGNDGGEFEVYYNIFSQKILPYIIDNVDNKVNEIYIEPTTAAREILGFLVDKSVLDWSSIIPYLPVGIIDTIPHPIMSSASNVINAHISHISSSLLNTIPETNRDYSEQILSNGNEKKSISNNSEELISSENLEKIIKDCLDTKSEDEHKLKTNYLCHREPPPECLKLYDVGELLHSTDPDRNQRVDFSNHNCYAIDSINASEIDDAISTEKTPDGKVWINVHISDFTSYFKSHQLILKILGEKYSSIYIPDRDWNMLISNKLIQKIDLRNTDRGLTFSAVIGKDGEIDDYKVVKSRLGKIKRLDYRRSAFLLNFRNPENKMNKSKGMKDETLPSDLDIKTNDGEVSNHIGIFGQENIDTSKDLKVIENEVTRHIKARIRNGHDYWIASKNAPVLSKKPTKTRFNPTHYESSLHKYYDGHFMDCGNPFESYTCSSSNLIVSESMIIANRVAAKFCQDNKIPAMYRGFIDFTYGGGQKNKWMQKIDKQLSIIRNIDNVAAAAGVKRTSYCPIKFNTRSLAFSTSPIPHLYMGIDGIGLSENLEPKKFLGYAQVTSPLRRFGDCINHWNIKAFLDKKECPIEKEWIEHNMKKFLDTSIKISKYGRSSVDYWLCMWLALKEFQSSDYVLKNKKFMKFLHKYDYIFPWLRNGIEYKTGDVFNKSILTPIQLPTNNKRKIYSIFLFPNIYKKNDKVFITTRILDHIRTNAYLELTIKEYENCNLRPGLRIEAVISAIYPCKRLIFMRPVCNITIRTKDDYIYKEALSDVDSLE